MSTMERTSKFTLMWPTSQPEYVANGEGYPPPEMLMVNRGKSPYDCITVHF